MFAHQSNGLLQQIVRLGLFERHPFPRGRLGPFRAEALLARMCPEGDQRIEFLFGHPAPLDAQQFRRVGRHEQHVAAPQQLFCARRVQDHA